jgi:hypothetical protein
MGKVTHAQDFNHPRTIPNAVQRSSSTTNGPDRTFSMASSTMQDWDLPDAPNTNHLRTTSEHTENWDDDFEVETRNRNPTSWTATPILCAETRKTGPSRLVCDVLRLLEIYVFQSFATSTHAVLPL